MCGVHPGRTHARVRKEWVAGEMTHREGEGEAPLHEEPFVVPDPSAKSPRQWVADSIIACQEPMEAGC